jgi:predicted Zn-dependent protease with MMP-like domain
MDMRRFEKLVGKAVDGIPKPFLQYIENVVFVVEPWPDDETLDMMGIDDEYGLLGLYLGDPISERSIADSGRMPDQIALYQHPIEAYAADTGEPVVKVIRDTILHEVGHYFGLSEEDLAEMGLE